MSNASVHVSPSHPPLMSRFTEAVGNTMASSTASYGAARGGVEVQCIVEDFHGRPASQPLSLSFSPERPVYALREVGDSRGLSPNFEKEVRFSSGRASSLGHGAAVPSESMRNAAAERSGGVASHADSRHECPSRGGGTTTLASSTSGLHVTHSGVVIPLIQGIPRPEGIPPETPVEYAKVKHQRASRRPRMAAKGAFSNMTSVAVLQQVQPLQLNARQVEPAGWALIAPSPMREEGRHKYAVTDDDGYETGDQRLSEAAGPGRRWSAARTAPGGMRDAAGGSACGASRSLSVTSLSPSEALMVAEAWEEDAEATARAMLDMDNCDDDEVQAMRVQAVMVELRRQQERQRQKLFAAAGVVAAPLAGPTAADAPTPSSPPPRFHATPEVDGGDGDQVGSHVLQRNAGAPTAAAPYAEAMANAAPYAVRTAACAQRSPARRAPSAEPAKVNGAAPPRTVAGPAAPALPRGFESYVERGQQRRAEAEWAQQVRAAEAAGEPLPPSPEHPPADDPHLGDAALASPEGPGPRRPRKMSVLPMPRGYETFALKGQSRRANADREEEERRADEAVNCTHHPRVNRPSLVSGSSLGSGAAGRRVAQQPEHEPDTVFERLNKEAERREQRRKQLQEELTPSFTPQGEAAAKATDENGGAARPRTAGRNVFEQLYAQARKDVSAATTPHAVKPKATTATAAAAAAAAGATAAVASQASARAAGAVSGRSDTVDSTPAAPAPPRKTQAEIEQHLASMAAREEESRVKWEHQPAAQASDEGGEARQTRIALNPKTDELAERARARYRVREELARQQRERAEAEAQKEAAKKSLLRLHGARRPPAQPSQAAAAQPPATPTPAAPARPVSPTPVRRAAAGEFYAHQLQSEERKRRHIDELRLQRAEEELNECTFRPRLTHTSERLAQRVVVDTAVDEYADSGRGRASLPVPPWDGAVVGEGSRGGSPVAPHTGAEYAGKLGHSRFVSSRSRSLLRELNRASPLVSYDRASPSPFAGAHAAAGEDVEGSRSASSEGFAYHVPSGAALEREPTALPRRPSGPVADQLRHLEEMLREWKELERECAPMLKQTRQAEVVE